MKQFKWQLINMEAASKLTPNIIQELSRAETATFFDETCYLLIIAISKYFFILKHNSNLI